MATTSIADFAVQSAGCAQICALRLSPSVSARAMPVKMPAVASETTSSRASGKRSRKVWKIFRIPSTPRIGADLILAGA